ncbi:PAS domain S-box protein [Thalassospira sp. SM2505]
MKRPVLLAKILAPLIVVAFVIGGGALFVLYKEILEDQRHAFLRLAVINAELINAVAADNRPDEPGNDKDPAFNAILSQIHSAFNNLSSLDASGELFIVQREGDQIRILVHQERKAEKDDHPALISITDPYAEPMLAALSGYAGTSWVTDSHDHDVLTAYAPAQNLGVAVVVGIPKDKLLEPFVSTSIALIIIGIAAIGLATAFTHSQVTYVINRFLYTQKHLQKALEETHRAQDMLEQALNSISEGFALFDAQDRLVICNDVYRQIYRNHADALKPGATFEEILRIGLARGTFPDAFDVEEIWLADRMAEHHKDNSKLEEQVGDRWILISERRTQDGGIVGVRTDITELKRKERELRDSEKKFRDFTVTASDWVWETDPQHRISQTSMQHIGNVNIDLDALIGKRRDEFTAEPANTPKWHDHYQALDERRPFKDFQYRITMADDAIRTISISGIPVFDDYGIFRGYRGTGRDITDLIESRERFRVAFESVTVGIIFADEKGTIEGFNPEAEKIFGYAAEEVLGQNVSILMPNPDHASHDDYIKNYLGTGDAQIIGIGREVKGKRKNETIFPMNLGIAEMNVQGRRHFIASITDLTVEHALERQLRRSQKMEAIGQLTGGVAHDFNNLLGIIIGNLDLARRQIDETSPVTKFIGKALTAADRGATLTRRLLNFSRQAPEENAAVILNDVLGDLKELVGKSITSSIAFTLSLTENIPPVRINQGDFEDAIINLAVNARDAMPDGGRLTIKTKLTRIDALSSNIVQRIPPGTYVELDVSDNGAGMPPEIGAQIFQPFFTTKERGKGTGLGLAMVYGFVKRSGGYISVYSELGIGTTFRIYLPVADEASQTETGNQRRDDTEPVHGTETILIVDDEQELAEIASIVLNKYGYRTILAHSGKEALEQIEKHPEIDILFTDVIMPGGMNGIELSDRACEMRPGLAVLTCSGFTADVLQERPDDKPIYPLISKPYTNIELAHAVRKTLDITEPA